MKLSRLIFFAALAVACPGINSCGGHGAAGVESSTSSKPPLPEVDVVTVKSQKLDSTVALPGELAPYEAVDMYAKVTGFVKSIKVDRGSSVRAGEVIAQLEAPEMAARRAQAEAGYQSAQSQFAAGQAKLASDQLTYQRMSNAAKVPGVVAGNDLDISQKAAQADEANVAALMKTATAAQEGLRAVAQQESYLNITAPFDGEVTTRYVHPGALVGPGGGTLTPIVRIETRTRHRLIVPVPENDASEVPEKTEVSFTVPSSPGKTFRAPITRISHGVDVKTRTMPVELDVNDPRMELTPGTFCEVQWPVRRTYATLFVPVSAVASDLQRTFVVRVRENKTEWVDVKTGARTGNLIEVFGDLQQGDEVANRGSDQLRAGTEVASRMVTTQ